MEILDNEAKLNETLSLKFDSNNLISDANCLIILSTHQDHFGQIKFCSEGVKKVFGYNSELLVERSANVLMPSFIASHHNKYMWDYLDSGHSAIINTNKAAYGLN